MMINRNGHSIELDREEDGQWIAEIALLPGCLAYGASEEEAVNNVVALAEKIQAEQVAA